MIKILNKQEKQEIEKQLGERFGIKSVQGMLLKLGQERIYLYSGNLNEKELKKLIVSVPIERLGVYFAKFVSGENQVKLSIEGTHALKNQIKKNIFPLNEQQTEDWMHGRDLDIKTGKRGFLVISYKQDFLGSGKASEFKIGNFIPKSRRLRTKTN